jgi:alpha-N-arabinofuranosidase
MDGPWQIGHMSAREYGMKAADASRQMRYVDPSLTLVACGSSGPSMPTYLQWDQEVLEQCFDYVDAISLHRYFGNDSETGDDSSKYLALNLEMEQQIAQVAAVCDVVQARKRSPKKLWLSFDEWNVWYRARSGSAVDGNRQEAPHLLEENYNLEDALLVGGLLNSLLRNSDRVRIACLAQLVNVIAPITTNDKGLLRQTIYYPYSWALQFAGGSVLDLLVQSPGYEVKKQGQVPFLDASAGFSREAGKLSLFALNRDREQPREVEVVWEDEAPTKLLEALVLTGNDLKASNSFEQPRLVAPQKLERPSTSNGRTRFELPARSYCVIQWSV